MRRMLRTSLQLLLVVLMGACAADVRGSGVWDGGGSDANWSTALNWNDDTVPQFNGTEVLTFGDAGLQEQAICDSVGTTAVDGLIVSRTGNFSVATGPSATLRIGTKGITATAPAADCVYTFSTTIELAADQTWRVADQAARVIVSGDVNTNGKTLTLQADRDSIECLGAISGAGSLVIRGQGQSGGGGVSLTGTNSYTGSTTVYGLGFLGLDYQGLNTSKLSATAPLAIRENGDASFFANEAGTTQTIGPLVLGAGNSGLRLYSNTNSMTLAAERLEREDYGTLSLWCDDLGTINGGRLTFATPPAISNAGLGLSRGILPYAWNLVSTTDLWRFEAVTVDGNSVRPLTVAEQTTTLTAGANVRIVASTELPASLTIGSLMIDGDLDNPITLSGVAGSRLTIQSGLIISQPLEIAQINIPELTFGPNPATGYEAIISGVLPTTISSNIVDNGTHPVGLTINGEVILTGHNTYTGVTRAVWGAVRPLSAESLPATTHLILSPGAGLDLWDDQTATSQSVTIGTLEGSGFVRLGNATLTVDVTGPSASVFSGTIFGDGNLTKKGDGTLKLTQEPFYTGDTTVAAGTLDVAGLSNHGATTVNGTLIAGYIRQDTLTIHAGGKVSIGAGGASGTSVVNFLSIADGSGGFSWHMEGGSLPENRDAAAPVPEPATWLLTVMAALAALLYRRRRG